MTAIDPSPLAAEHRNNERVLRYAAVWMKVLALTGLNLSFSVRSVWRKLAMLLGAVYGQMLRPTEIVDSEAMRRFHGDAV